MSDVASLVTRIVDRVKARWARKDTTHQSCQRIDEIVALALPVMNAAMAHPKPPPAHEAANAAVQSVLARGWATDLEDEAIAAMVRARLEAHWRDVLDQRARAERRASRAGNVERRPPASRAPR